ncbi:MAG: hypothetical protein P8Z40_12445 [Chloroflexota bacterium]
MNKQTQEYLRDIPMKPYDLLKEGLIVLLVISGVVLVLAILFGSPDYPAVRSVDVASRQPILYLKTSANILAGNSDLQGYGPPYTPDTANAQQVFGIAPANWFGVTDPINPPQDFVLAPLNRVAKLNSDVAAALQAYQAASPDQQQAWVDAYLAALDKATVSSGQVQVPEGDYGPVATMMDGMLQLGQAGLLEGTLNSADNNVPYMLNPTLSLLFFQDDVDQQVANSLDMLGGQWGMSHETGPYPGGWWTAPASFLYQIPPMSSSPNADLQIGLLLGLVFLVMLFLPFIPVLNKLPRWLGVYKIIWRDWYQKQRSESKASGNRPAEHSSASAD